MGQRLTGIVVQRVGHDEPVGTTHLYIIVEHGIACIQIVLSPVGH